MEKWPYKRSGHSQGGQVSSILLLSEHLKSGPIREVTFSMRGLVRKGTYCNILSTRFMDIIKWNLFYLWNVCLNLNMCRYWREKRGQGEPKYVPLLEWKKGGGVQSNPNQEMKHAYPSSISSRSPLLALSLLVLQIMKIHQDLNSNAN